ncbi:hypothetical protein IQ61_27405 [Streptomyces scabiei]|nr:hypothetical protein IQ61_27405 [Streptomyces scabiei]
MLSYVDAQRVSTGHTDGEVRSNKGDVPVEGKHGVGSISRTLGDPLERVGVDVPDYPESIAAAACAQSGVSISVECDRAGQTAGVEVVVVRDSGHGRGHPVRRVVVVGQQEGPGLTPAFSSAGELADQLIEQGGIKDQPGRGHQMPADGRRAPESARCSSCR